jgi:hypothetical protein
LLSATYGYIKPSRGIQPVMQRYIQNLGLSPRWWWGSVAGVVVIALIFLGAGSVAAALVCLACAAAIAALALSARSSGPKT